MPIPSSSSASLTTPRVDSKPIGSGPAFLTSENLVRGFKVHATVVDPLATPLVAQNIEIETARYDGAISSPERHELHLYPQVRGPG